MEEAFGVQLSWVIAQIRQDKRRLFKYSEEGNSIGYTAWILTNKDPKVKKITNKEIIHDDVQHNINTNAFPTLHIYNVNLVYNLKF